MQKKFVFNLILLISLNLLIKPFYILGIDTEILERVGQAEYGSYFALLNLSFMLNIFLDLGIVNFNTNYIAKHEHLVSKHFSRIVGLRFLLTLLYLFICLGVGTVLGYEGHQITLLLPICINQVLAGLIMYLRSNLAGLQLYVRDSMISVLDRIILITCCAAILWGKFTGLEMSIEIFVFLQTAAYSITAIIALFALKSRIQFSFPKINYSFSIIVLKKSFPYALLILLMNFYYRTDGVMIERLLENGAFEAGVYAQAFRFFEAGNMISYLFAALLFPMFSRLLGERKEVRSLLILSYKIILVGSVIASVGGYFFSAEIMDLRFSSEIDASSDAFKYLMIGFLGVSGTYIFGTLLTANGNLKELNIMAVGGAVLNIVLNLYLIPKYQAKGAAVASMITQLIMAVLQIILVWHKMQISLSMKLIVKSLSFILICAISCYFLKAFISNWMLSLGVFSILTILASMAFNILSLKSLVQYFQLSRELRS